MRKNTAKEEAIKKNMEILGVSKEEAEEIWLFDNDEIEVPEVTAIEEKIESNQKDKKRSSIEKVKYMKAKKKKDANKELVIGSIFEFIKENEMMILPQTMAANKMTFMDEVGSYYTVTITKHTKGCPDGYSGIEKEKIEE